MNGEFCPSFITVKYGDNEQALFNPWCPGYVLLECIRKKCACDTDVTIDLVDLEGQVKNLANRRQEYAHNYVDGRGTYILIKVDKPGEKEPIRYTSLLNDIDTHHPELTEKLSNMSKTGRTSKKDNSSNSSRWGVMRSLSKMNGKLKVREGRRSKDKA